MGSYQRKIETVDARQLTVDNVDILAQWCGGMKVEEKNPRDPSDVYVGLNVPTISGGLRVSQGDWLVKQENGVFVKYTAFDFNRQFEEQ